MPKTEQLLGVKINSTSTGSVLGLVSQWLDQKSRKPRFIVTAYSETIIEAGKNAEFKRALDRADLVVPDGVSVVAGLEYIKRHQTNSGGVLADLLAGFEVGLEILQRKFSGRVVPGVWLMEELIGLAGQKGWKVMLVGGFGRTAEESKSKFKSKYDNLDIEALAGPGNLQLASQGEVKRLIVDINQFAPDLLFVSFGRFRQEMWISRNLDKLKAGMVMGVGSAFDEIAGVGPWARPAPDWVERMGLKWLWRVRQDPRHLMRAFRAALVFPWKVFVSTTP